jgi:hypothetical protein
MRNKAATIALQGIFMQQTRLRPEQDAAEFVLAPVDQKSTPP